MFGDVLGREPYQSVAHIIICCSKAIALMLPPPTSVPDPSSPCP